MLADFEALISTTGTGVGGNAAAPANISGLEVAPFSFCLFGITALFAMTELDFFTSEFHLFFLCFDSFFFLGLIGEENVHWAGDEAPVFGTQEWDADWEEPEERSRMSPLEFVAMEKNDIRVVMAVDRKSTVSCVAVFSEDLS